MFIGNDPIEITSTGVAAYTVGLDLTQSNRYRVTTQDGSAAETELASSGFNIAGTLLTLTTAPSNGVTIRVYYNSEIQMRNEPSADTKTSITLAASGSAADTGISWDADDYNCAIVTYSLNNAATPAGMRSGKMTILVDTRAGVQDYYLQDDYSAVNTVDVVFDGNLNTSDNVFKIRYTDNDAQNATMNYELELWKTTLA